MKINKIENMTLGNMTVKKNLTEADFVLLKDTLKTLVKTYAFFEHEKGYDNEDIFVPDYDPEFPKVNIILNEEQNGILLGDYIISSAFLTEKEQVIISAHPLINLDFGHCVASDKTEYFLATILNRGYTTDELYYCFITDVPIPTVTI